MKSETFKLSKLRNIALAGILAAGVVGPTYVASTAHAEDAANQAAEQQSDQSQEGTDDSNSFVKDLLGSNDTTDADANDPTKTETVYVFNNADGSARNAIVTDWLKNVKGDQSLADVSNLTDIENTESQAGYQQDGQKLTWDAQGDDIYYKGNTTEQAPVTIKVTYWLDGQEIAPDDLAGKSGHVKIRYDYTNNASYQTEVNGEQRTMYTPFVAATGLILDNSNFKNVTTVNGKIANDGDRTTVAGFAMPGLQEDLDISSDDVDIPTYFEIEADATDFSLDTSLTAVSSNLFDSINTDDMSEDTLGDDINKMNDAMNQLIDGSSSLYDGLTQLADGAGQLADGSATLASGTDQLASGASQLPAGVAKLYNGSDAVDAGLEALKNGNSKEWGLAKAAESSKDAYIGAQKIAAGVNTLADQMGAIQTGAKKMAAGADAASTGTQTAINTISDQMIPALSDAQAKLNKHVNVDGAVASLKDAQSTLTSLSTQTKGIADQLTTVSSGLSKVSASLGQIESQSTQAASDADTAADHIAKSNYAGVTAAAKQLAAIDTTGMTDDQIAALNKAKSQLDAVSTGDLASAQSEAKSAADANTQIKQEIAGVKKSVDTLQSGIAQQAEGFQKASESLAADAKALQSTASSLSDDDYVVLEQEVAQVNAGLKQMVGSSNDTSSKPTLYGLEKGINEIGKGASDLSTQISNGSGKMNELVQGAGDLRDGLKVLSEGGTVDDKTSAGLEGAVKALGDTSTPDTLLYGSNAIWQGLAKMNASAPALASGVNQVNDGAQQLAAGSSRLASGAVSAQDGSAQLSDGLKQFNDEAIQKIVSAYNDNLAGLSDNLKATAQAGKDYQTFSGKDDAMQGKVTFIYETDGIGD
jgi:putative membrane protein